MVSIDTSDVSFALRSGERACRGACRLLRVDRRCTAVGVLPDNEHDLAATGIEPIVKSAPRSGVGGQYVSASS